MTSVKTQNKLFVNKEKKQNKTKQRKTAGFLSNFMLMQNRQEKLEAYHVSIKRKSINNLVVGLFFAPKIPKQEFYSNMFFDLLQTQKTHFELLSVQKPQCKI